MNDDDVKRMLGDLPGRDLPPGAMERIERVVEHAASAIERDRQCAWWRREMPRWQALAACAAVSAVVGVATRAVSVTEAPTSVADGGEAITDPTPPASGSTPLPPRRRLATDITRWSVLDIHIDQEADA